MKNSKGQIVVTRKPWDYDPGSLYIMYLATPKEISALFHENYGQVGPRSRRVKGTQT